MCCGKNNVIQSLVLFINSLVGSFWPKIGHPHCPNIDIRLSKILRTLKANNYPYCICDCIRLFLLIVIENNLNNDFESRFVLHLYWISYFSFCTLRASEFLPFSTWNKFNVKGLINSHLRLNHTSFWNFKSTEIAIKTYKLFYSMMLRCVAERMFMTN